MSGSRMAEGISSTAFKYLRKIDEKYEKLGDKMEMSSFNIDYSVSEKVNSIFPKSYSFIVNSTDVMIDDTDMCYKPETTGMSFMQKLDSIFEDENTNFMTTSTNDNIFDGQSSLSGISPPVKRFRNDKEDSFFYKPKQSSVMMDTFFKQGLLNSTEEIFNTKHSKELSFQSINFLDTFSKPVDEIKFDLTSQSSVKGFSEDKIFQDSQQESTFLKENTTFIEMGVEAVESKQELRTNEEDSIKKRPTKANTFYQVPCLMDTNKIDEYYKTHQFSDWESIEKNIDSLLEPSLDYIAYRYKRLKPITIGNVEETITYEDDLINSDSINETVDEIKGSFDKGLFICSTPDRSKSYESKSQINPLDEEFSDFHADSSKNPCMTQQLANEEDPDKTRSFLVNKESENVWSALTHVSCSIPPDDQTKSEPIFDITTIFDFDNKYKMANDQNVSNVDQEKSLDNEITRYQLLLSILNDCDNPFEKTSSDLHETLRLVQTRKAAIMSQIEMLIHSLVTSLVKQESMVIKFHKVKEWKDCKYDNNILSQKETAITTKSLSFTNKNTSRTFTITVHLLGEIYKLLCSNTTCTKRELYYRDVELMRNQNAVNKAIDEICALLNVQCWELGVLSTSKGLVAGDLRITTEDNEIIDYTTTNLVPQKVSGITSMESNAEYILVVEKDTVFTRLIEDKIMEKIGKKIILVTSKGYPDINTRLLLKKFETDLRKPIYIIVDADPYGIDIMCTYKYGSLQMVNFSEQLAITKMEWIGIYPTDIEKLDITRIELTDADKKKVDELLARPYMNKHLEDELKYLKDCGLKAEIESIYHFSIDYLIHDYIPQKIELISTTMDQIFKEANSFRENIF